MSTHMSTSYLDIRIRFHSISAGFGNFHLLGFPIYQNHSADVLFNSCKKLLDVLCPAWERLIVGITTDGERKMTGKVSGVATRFQRVSEQGFIRVWCAAHQLDLVLQAVYRNFAEESFYFQLTGLISYLRRQQNLISAMRSQVPKVADTRWESMVSVSLWLKIHRVEVLEYLKEKMPACFPPAQWWVLISVIEAFSRNCSATFKSLQGHHVTVSQQRHYLDTLITQLLHDIGGIGPLSDDQAQELSISPSMWLLSNCRLFAINLQYAANFILDMGSFISDRIEEMEGAIFANSIIDSAKLYVEAVSKISKIVAERDSNNHSLEYALPACVPQDLVKLTPRDFCTIVRQHKSRLQQRWNSKEIDLIEQQHREFLDAYRRDSVLKQSIEDLHEHASFETSWKITSGRFYYLETFCGGLATVFPGTAQVESDFSILNHEKDKFKTFVY
eukprot:Sdes_comp20995_c0_seq5m19729